MKTCMNGENPFSNKSEVNMKSGSIRKGAVAQPAEQAGRSASSFLHAREMRFRIKILF